MSDQIILDEIMKNTKEVPLEPGIRFKCKAESLKAILDRLPTAKILSKVDDIYTIYRRSIWKRN